MAEDDELEPGEIFREGVGAAILRARDWGIRVTGSPANVITGGGTLWAQAIAFAQAATTDDGADGWTSLGPRNVGGAVRALVQDPDPAHHSTFWAGTAGGGLWRTNDDGNTWEPLGEPFFGVPPVCAVAVAPSDRNVIWVGTGEAWTGDVPGVGLWRSLDGGATFQKLANPGSAANGDADHYTRILVDPRNAKRAWVACERGLWRFEDTVPTQEMTNADVLSDLAMCPDPATPANLVLLAAVLGVGVRRAVYNRAAGTTGAFAATSMRSAPPAAAPVPNIGRVRVAIAESNTARAYALVEDTTTGAPMRIFQSNDNGLTFQQPAGAAGWPNDTTSTQAFYSMVVEVHPNNHRIVVAGHVNIYVSNNDGVTWNFNPVANAAGFNAGFTDWFNNLTFATVAEHGDMHAIVFDRRDRGSATPRIWLGNDGGISTTNQWAAPFNWRKRSYGILGSQAVDGQAHPGFPSMMGIGMQDNATFFSYGGPTWYQVGPADGGAVAWNPANVRTPHISWQFTVAQLTIGTAQVFQTLRQPLPEVANPPGPGTNRMVSGIIPLALPAPAGGFNTGAFRQLLVGDGVTANRVLASGSNAAYITINGTNFTVLPTNGVVGGVPQAGFTPLPGGTVQSSALTFVPGVPSNRAIYVGTSSGDIFAPPTAAAPAPWVRTNPFTAAGAAPPWIAFIAVHPANTNVVAACAYLANQRVMLSHDAGRNWFDASGTASRLPTAPVTSLAWHPTDEKVLYAGTMVGVFVARDLPAFVAAPGTATNANPTWRTFNRGMGPLWVNDLEVVANSNVLRATTFARGVYEASLRGTGATYATQPNFKVTPVRLSIRDHVFDDSRPHLPANLAHGSPPTNDPRLPAANPVPHLSGRESFDIKVNAPEARDRTAYLLSERFGHSPDGAELDELFACENPIAGDTNIVYVQVHNRGYQRAENVQCLLYCADAGAPPGTAPVLDGLSFPADPPANNPWRLVGQQTSFVLPGQPRVFRFLWVCPLEFPRTVALFAICRSPDDELAPAPVPAGVALTYALSERRAALRILPVVPDRVFIRDGLDDTGQAGSVVWGGRSPDIMVMTRAAGDLITPVQQDDPAGPFANLNDPRRGDRVHQGNNTIFVRVNNRGSIPINAQVQLFQVPLNQIQNGAAWTAVGGTVAVNGIAPRGWKTARFQLNAVPAGGVAGATADWQRAFVFAAICQAVNPGAGGAVLESFPDRNLVTGVDEFWNMFTRGALASNAAFRSLLFATGGP